MQIVVFSGILLRHYGTVFLKKPTTPVNVLLNLPATGFLLLPQSKDCPGKESGKEEGHTPLSCTLNLSSELTHPKFYVFLLKTCDLSMRQTYTRVYTKLPQQLHCSCPQWKFLQACNLVIYFSGTQKQAAAHSGAPGSFSNEIKIAGRCYILSVEASATTSHFSFAKKKKEKCWGGYSPPHLNVQAGRSLF